MEGTLCGVWIDGEGRARVSLATADGGRREATQPSQAVWHRGLPARSKFG